MQSFSTAEPHTSQPPLAGQPRAVAPTAWRSSARADAAPVLQADDLGKRFGGLVALDGVGLKLYPGEVMALLGENGAGKSTLVKLLSGVYRIDQGSLSLAGRSLSFARPKQAWAAGITAIHQEAAMFDELSVAENIFVGHMKRTRFGRLDWSRMRSEAQTLLRSLECDVAVTAPLKTLGVAEKHLVQIARALSHSARIVIMDEPTAALSTREIEDLFRIVRQLKAEGRSILFVSHKFDEIFSIADRWTCLRDGRQVGEGMIADVTQNDLVRLMVGRTVEKAFPKRPVELGANVLSVQSLGNRTEFADVTFSLRRGEILGFYGLIGAGRSEAMQGLFGLSKHTTGRVEVEGRAVSIARPADAIAAGIALVPEDRQHQGGILEFDSRRNITLASLGSHSFGPFINYRREMETTRRLGSRLSVKAAFWDQPIQELSGGNQQKVVIAKWLALNPKVIILDEPTKGIDIGSKAAVHEFIVELAEQGLAVILVSSELPEVMGMSDRILVMHEGRIVRGFARADFSSEAIVTAAAGASKDHV